MVDIFTKFIQYFVRVPAFNVTTIIRTVFQVSNLFHFRNPYNKRELASKQPTNLSTKQSEYKSVATRSNVIRALCYTHHNLWVRIHAVAMPRHTTVHCYTVRLHTNQSPNVKLIVSVDLQKLLPIHRHFSLSFSKERH